MFAVFVILLEVRPHLRRKQAVNLIRRKSLIPEDFVPLLVFLRLSPFQNTVFIWPRQNHLSAFRKIIAVFIHQPYLVFKRRVAVGKELLIGNESLKLDFIKHENTADFSKEMPFNSLIFEQ